MHCSKHYLPATLLAGLALASFGSGPARPAEAEPVSRKFRFTYAATVTGLKPGQVARLWVPIAPATAEQDVKVIGKELPAKRELIRQQLTRDPTYGNIILYVEARADREGKVPLQVTYEITRREVRAGKDGIPKKEAQKQIARFLKPDSRVPTEGKPLATIEEKLIKNQAVPKDPLEAGRLFYNAVNKHMTYAKDAPGWGRGDSLWACGSGRGNCTDFHSLFISLARAHHMPAKFEIGFPLPEKQGKGEIAGYHCWAWFIPRDKGWVPVDISEANKNPKMSRYYFGNLTADRVAFSTGRDIELVPKAAGSALNFFIYPYVEVDGKPYEKMEKKFSYKDL